MSVITRREFIKYSGVAASGLLLSQLGFDLTPVKAYAAELRIKDAKATPTICCFCSTSCGILMHTDSSGKLINAEGDPDHPISEGSLCAKGAASYQIAVNPNRLSKVRYRAPYSDKWKEVSWEWALEKIAANIKKSRDKSFIEKNAEGKVVNRTNGIASVGSAAMDNEECWLYQKMLRALGLVYIEHQARLCHSSTVPALAESFGRGAMTNHYIDFRNADVILNMGGNVAECHPVSFKWIQEARNRGAILIHVDPRFTRTSAKADIHAYIRPGTDIAFLGGMIKYILDNNLYDEFYVKHYTNASFIVNPNFGFDDGLFSGYDPSKRVYDTSTWAFEKDENGIPKRDMTLQHERCVFQLLKKHYSRYTLEKVTAITGTPQKDLEKIYKVYGSTGTPDKAGTELYAMGWTQHTVGVQNIRAMALIQLLLGNIGIAGGGVNALRGESNVQGSTD
ncbi:MAG: molybdopterin-dependent oxidoreductase, partial [Thermodesulfovibrionales bacterium]